jgi:glycerophosphoryl diester phosphodiesterase
VDAQQVRTAHAAGIRVVPWTVNQPEQWQRLLTLGVDGITTDYPDQLASFLAAAGVAF